MDNPARKGTAMPAARPSPPAAARPANAPAKPAAARPASNVGTRQGHWFACESMPNVPADCGFQVRNENRAQLVKMAIEHARVTHNKTMTEAEMAPAIKAVKF